MYAFIESDKIGVYKHVKSKCVIQKWLIENVDQSGMLYFYFMIFMLL